MKTILLFISLLISISGIAQISYSGFIDKYPIELVIQGDIVIDGESDISAIYVYDKHDTPIVINGKFSNNSLELYEKDKNDSITATFVFENFFLESDEILGEWINNKSNKRLSVELTKTFTIEWSDSEFSYWDEEDKRELLQAESTQNHYFKLVTAKSKGEYTPQVTRVKIFEKKTDRLIQKIDLDCDLPEWGGFNGIEISDYNFDGIDDFSVFQYSYAGSYTSLYILRKPDSEEYFLSDFSFDGGSITFDSESKTIKVSSSEYEHRWDGTYKVMDNQMVIICSKSLEYDDEMNLIKSECHEYDENGENPVEVKCE